MALISQFSRISHHTVALSATTSFTGKTFTVPGSEDFTLGGWSIYDLALSEIGVDEFRNKAYIRIGNNINEFNFGTGATSTTIIQQFTGNTSASCISNLYVSNLYGCSPITVRDQMIHKDYAFYTPMSAYTTFGSTIPFLTGASGNVLVTKEYVDSLSNGLNEQGVIAVKCVQLVNLTGITYNNGTAGIGAILSGNTNYTIATGGLFDDNLVAGDRVLVRSQTNQTQNGVYEVLAVGGGVTNFILQRTTDADETIELDPQVVIPTRGSLAGRRYGQITQDPIIGTSNIVYADIGSQFVTQNSSGIQLDGQIAYWTSAGLRLSRGTSNLYYNQVLNRMGIGTNNPDSTLQVSGKTKTINFQMTSGATNNYVLTSDANGNARWAPGGGSTSANCVTDFYVTNIYGCSPITIKDSIQSDTSTATGLLSFAFGDNNLASGDYSQAYGGGLIASGNYSHAEGGGSVASGNYSHAEGAATSAVGDYSHSEGNSTLANADSCHAEGQGTQANGLISHAEGFNTVAGGNKSHAEGDQTQANGLSSHAEGLLSVTNGEASHAEGGSTTATGDYSHAEGFSTQAFGVNSHAEGNTTTANGNSSHAEGVSTIADGEGSHAEGYGTTATGDYSHAEGHQTTATGRRSHAEGDGTIAQGDDSHAEGNNTIARGGASHAEGSGSEAKGDYSHAEGRSTITEGNNSHSEGHTTIAWGASSHAEGQATQAVGNWSHSEGFTTIASGVTSHAGGMFSEAKNYGEFARSGSNTQGGLLYGQHGIFTMYCNTNSLGAANVTFGDGSNEILLIDNSAYRFDIKGVAISDTGLYASFEGDLLLKKENGLISFCPSGLSKSFSSVCGTLTGATIEMKTNLSATTLSVRYGSGITGTTNANITFNYTQVYKP